jgi:hypothetical protein
MKLLFSIVAYVAKYTGPLDSRTYLSWWVGFSLVFCAACLVLECFYLCSFFGVFISFSFTCICMLFNVVFGISDYMATNGHRHLIDLGGGGLPLANSMLSSHRICLCVYILSIPYLVDYCTSLCLGNFRTLNIPYRIRVLCSSNVWCHILSVI